MTKYLSFGEVLSPKRAPFGKQSNSVHEKLVQCHAFASGHQKKSALKDRALSSVSVKGDGVAGNAEASEAQIAVQPRSVFLEPQRREQSSFASSADFYSLDTFEALGASEAMVYALGAIGIRRPAIIQSAAMKAISVHEGHLLLADHSGSGKTLAYLIPIMCQLRKHEAVHGHRHAQANSPAAVILAPTQELCAQVRAVAKAIASNGMPFSIKLMTGGLKGKRTQKQALQGAPDIVIGTPARLSELLASRSLSMACCQALVLDEVDILRSEASLFHDEVEPLLQAAPPGMRAILVTASLSQLTWMELQNQFPGLKPVFGPGLHRPAPGSLEQLIDCSGGEEINEDTAYKRKAAAMLQVIKDQAANRTVVFCNKLMTCRKVENTLKRTLKAAQIVLPYHAGIEERQRQSNLKEFVGNDSGPKLLVCTDRASRGLDTSRVEHVIMFDFPRDPSEYLRRAGRTARGATGKGVVSLLVLGRQVRLAKQILDRNESGQPLHQVPIA